MKRGQYALEFLFTYGWAFLLITVIVGALYAFGWLDVSTVLPQECEFFGQVVCTDFFVQGDELPAATGTDAIFLNVSNDFAADLCITSITAQDGSDLSCAGDSVSIAPLLGDCQAGEVPWQLGQEIGLELNTCGGKSFVERNRIDMDIGISFYNPDTCPSASTDCIYTAYGSITARID